ncbi:MAG: hypothetical protein ACC657_07460 [Thiohalomonadales bacterium]
MSNHEKNENKDFDEYLTGNSELSSLYHGSNNLKGDTSDYTPGLELDNIILSAAKREVNAKTGKTTKSYSAFSNNYLIPLSTAASIIIVVAVLGFFPEEQPIEFEPHLVTPDAIVAEQELQKNPGLTSGILAENKKLDSASVKNENTKSESIGLKRTKLKQRKAIRNKQLALNEDVSKSQEPPVQEVKLFSDNSIKTVAVINNDLIYDANKWKNLSPGEWRKRILEIYRTRGESDAKEIINFFNKKFPEIKLTISDIINENIK